MERTSEFKYKTYLTVLLLCMITLVVLAFKAQSQNISEYFNYKGAEASPEKKTRKSKCAVMEKCLDGEIYNDKKAPIYRGDIYGDSKKQAKEVRKYMQPYLKKKGFDQYTDILVAICAQESRFGTLDYRNWMQVKGYSGKDGISSTKAGMDHFIQLVKHAEKLKCKDMVAIIQAYNFGNYYLDYCMDHGGKDTPELRTSFQAHQKKRTKKATYGDINYAEKITQRIESK